MTAHCTCGCLLTHRDGDWQHLATLTRQPCAHPTPATGSIR